MKRKQSKQANTGLTVKEYNWGSMFHGSKAVLIRAGLAKPEHFKFRKGEPSKGHWLPLDWSERYNNAISTAGPMPLRWDAVISEGWPEAEYAVSVSYNNEDMGFRERAEHALIALQAAVKMVAQIAPKPVHVQLGYKVEPKGKS